MKPKAVCNTMDEVPRALKDPQWPATHSIHLVHSYNQLPHPETANEQCMLPGLPTTIETSLKLARRCIDRQERKISLGSSRDHVRNEILVPRCIQQGKCAVRRLEVSGRNVNGNTAR